MKPFHTIIITVGVIAMIFVARLGYLQLMTDIYVLNAANTSIKIEYIIILHYVNTVYNEE